MPNRVKAILVKGQTIKTIDFSCEVKVILSLKSICPDGMGAKTGLNGPHNLKG